VAHLCAQNADTVLWSRDPEVAEQVTDEHRNLRYLEPFPLDESLRATADLAEAVSEADVVFMGVPSHGFRSTLQVAAPHLRAWVPIVSLAKGLEQSTRRRMSEVVQEEVPGHPYGVLTGPNLAKEILAGHAAAAVLAMSDDNVADQLQQIIATDVFRVYTNPDVIGAEIGGALKNVMAIASGMADGLGTGDNTRAAVITRSLAELTRLGQSLGGNPMTFAGLAGMGDLIATCISTQSRNRHVGEQLGKGRTIDEITAEMRQVAEGVRSAPVVMELAREHDVEMPVAEQVHAVCHEGRTAPEAYRGLLARARTTELHGLDLRPR
jgi:glycerol-3-phosphate dehydrogenase (NAD(P)+)